MRTIKEAMMAKSDLTNVKHKLIELNEFISNLDENIRAPSFDLLLPYYLEEIEGKAPDDITPTKKGQQKPAVVDTSSRENFFDSFTHDKPADNVHLIVAWLYSQHGVIPLTAKLLRELADDVGLTIPDRPDTTMYAATKDGKSFYRKKGKGYQLTVHGEAHVKKSYNVKKGTAPFTEPEENQ
jgi:hypothetical protein